MESPIVQQPPLSAPLLTAPPGGTSEIAATMLGGPMPPPSADARLPWPPPGGEAPAGWPAGTQASLPPIADPPFSDTVERMLRPQGLFQNRQMKPFDWQQPWGAPAPGQYPAPGQPEPLAQYQPGNGYQPGGAAAAPLPLPSGTGYPAPGQYGAGDFAATQAEPAPYAPGQYGHEHPGQFGQFSQGQYPSGQSGWNGQYPPSGQYPPDGQFAPNGQFVPDGLFPGGMSGKPRPRLSRGTLLTVSIAAVAAVIAGAAVMLSSHGGGSAPESAGTATAGATQQAASSGGASAAARRRAATRLAGLLPQSGTDRADVTDAVLNVKACGTNLAKDARIFTKAAGNRHALLTRLADLPGRSALPAAMVSDLTGAWRASATVDEDLAKWASDAAAGCRKGNLNDPNYKASLRHDGTASADKEAFTRLWNPLARKDGLSTYQADQL